MCPQVESKSKFQRFLDSVCEDPSEYFESIENITMRYETLNAAHEDLTKRVDKAQQEQEKDNSDFASFVKTSQNKLLVYNSDIAKKQQHIDYLRLTTTDNEASLSKGDNEAKENTRQLGEIKMTINNIYNRCVRVRGPNGPEELEGFLDAIKQRVVDLQEIVTGKGGPVGMQELAKAVADAAGKKAALVNADALYAIPERVKQNAPPGGAAAGAGAGESVSPGSVAGAESKAGKPSTFRQSKDEAGGSAANMSSGPASRATAQIS